MKKPLSILALLALLCSALAPAAMGAVLPMDMLCCKRAVRTVQHCHGMAMDESGDASMPAASPAYAEKVAVANSGKDCRCCRPDAQLVAAASSPIAASAPHDARPFLSELSAPEPQAAEQSSSSERGPPSSLGR